MLYLIRGEIRGPQLGFRNRDLVLYALSFQSLETFLCQLGSDACGFFGEESMNEVLLRWRKGSDECVHTRGIRKIDACPPESTQQFSIREAVEIVRDGLRNEELSCLCI